MGYEKAAERWLPVHTVETILVSVISMLSVRANAFLMACNGCSANV